MHKLIGISTLFLIFFWSISFFLAYGLVAIAQVLIIFIVAYGVFSVFPRLKSSRHMRLKSK